jgi:hypothetical protein
MFGKLKIRPLQPTVTISNCPKGVHQFRYHIILHQQYRHVEMNFDNRNGEDLRRVPVGNPEGKRSLEKNGSCVNTDHRPRHESCR